MLSHDLEVSLNSAIQDARSQRHELITVEHLLIALLDNANSAEVLRACGGNLSQLREDLAQFLTENMAGDDYFWRVYC